MARPLAATEHCVSLQQLCFSLLYLLHWIYIRCTLVVCVLTSGVSLLWLSYCKYTNNITFVAHNDSRSLLYINVVTQLHCTHTHKHQQCISLLTDNHTRMHRHVLTCMVHAHAVILLHLWSCTTNHFAFTQTWSNTLNTWSNMPLLARVMGHCWPE